jgi:uncharacterized protein (TIGR02646 family)
MIRVKRVAEPKVLKQNATHWSNALSNALHALAALHTMPQAPTGQVKQAKKKIASIQKKYRHQEVKDTLVEMFHGKCAYCESSITVITYGQIEHFYPKSAYPDKTFAWDNLLLSCDKCNNTHHKGTHFPLDSAGQPLLIDPTDVGTDPFMHLRFFWDEETSWSSVYGLDERGKKVVEIFDLNGSRGRMELMRERSSYIKQLLCVLKLYEQTKNSEAFSLLQAACSPEEKYSAFALSLVAPHI